MSLHSTNKVIQIDPLSPDPDSIRIGAHIINEGGVIVFPTQCLYGLGADAKNEAAVERIFAIKERPLDKPILILIPATSYLGQVVKHIPPAALRLMEAFWPGNLTLLFEANPALPVGLTAGTGKIGVRLPKHPVAFELVKEAGCPVTGTSANLSGGPGCDRISELSPKVAERVDLIIDAGELKGGVGSTIVDATQTPPLIVREGILKTETIHQFLRGPAGGPGLK